ncbi:MAG TPA: carboxymuconolactone decarboxylase family protein [Methylomirabilota bacterium]|nr:carboxymuconolactone decarboxylase family protein [Methylomirabilota bacterium]
MNPIAPHLDHAHRRARREHLDGLIQDARMKVPPAMKALGREVFAAGALPKKHKELTALAIAVANNCWE